MLAEDMQGVGNEGVITVEEAKSLETELEVVEGMQFDRGYLSPYFVTDADKMQAVLDDPYILIHEKKLSGLQPFFRHLEAGVQPGNRRLAFPEAARARALGRLAVNGCVGGLQSPPGKIGRTTLENYGTNGHH